MNETLVDSIEFAYSGLGMPALEMMLLIREFESRLESYAKEGLIRGSTHPAAGMEAIAVGVCLATRRDDTIASTHRGHAHCLAKGADPGRLLAEIFGRSDGFCGGKGGSMHAGVAEHGILGTNGIVGASIGIATGSALAAQHQQRDSVSIAFFGDGAVNQGIFHEALNLAAIWSLPVIYVCENNQYAQSAPIAEMVGNTDLTARAVGYGIPAYSVDGMDVADVFQVAAQSIAHARSGGGPSLIVADTYRFLGHMVGDTEIYRDHDEVDRWRARDPIEALAAALIERRIVDASVINTARVEANRLADQAEQYARLSPPPSPQAAYEHVYKEL
jgi:acetoin:2,6-dichlorophenolindophenol oxidoreductase subunit alpha